MVALLMRVVVYFVQEVGITDIARAHGAACIKLLENSKQHHGHNEPDGNFRKPLIVQRGSNKDERDEKNKKRCDATEADFRAFQAPSS